MNRRQLFKGAFGLAASGLLVLAGVDAAADDVRRIFAPWSTPSGRQMNVVNGGAGWGPEDVGRLFLYDGRPYVVALSELPKMGTASIVIGHPLGPNETVLEESVPLKGRVISVEMADIRRARSDVSSWMSDFRLPR